MFLKMKKAQPEFAIIKNLNHMAFPDIRVEKRICQFTYQLNETRDFS